MKLLDKKQVTLSKANEQRIAIEEGVNLAKKVDALRQASLTEEKNLDAFRTQALQKIKQEINAVLDKKLEIQSEVNSLLEEKNLLSEIVETKWKAVKGDKRIAKVELLKKILQDKIDALKQTENLLEEGYQDFKNEEQRIATRKEESERILSDAYSLRESIERDSIALEEKKRATLDVLKERSKQVIATEVSVAVRERSTSDKEQFLNKREQDLNNQERRLQDRQQTLLRTISRLEKK